MTLSYRDNKARDDLWAEILDRVEILQGGMRQYGLQYMESRSEEDLLTESYTAAFPSFKNGGSEGVSGYNLLMELPNGGRVDLQTYSFHVVNEIFDFIRAYETDVRADLIELKVGAIYGVCAEINGDFSWKHPDVARTPSQIADWAEREVEQLVDRLHEHTSYVAKMAIEAWGERWPDANLSMGSANGDTQIFGDIPNRKYPEHSWLRDEEMDEHLPGLREEFEAFNEVLNRINGQVTYPSFELVRAKPAEPDIDESPAF